MPTSTPRRPALLLDQAKKCVKPGAKGAPTAKAFKESAKTAKKGK
jgi:hypothetical protein